MLVAALNGAPACAAGVGMRLWSISGAAAAMMTVLVRVGSWLVRRGRVKRQDQRGRRDAGQCGLDASLGQQLDRKDASGSANLPCFERRMEAPSRQEENMSRLIRMDQTGHTTLAEWTTGDPGSVEAASAAFRSELEQGYFAVVSNDASHAEQVHELPVQAPLVILRRPIAGG